MTTHASRSALALPLASILALLAFADPALARAGRGGGRGGGGMVGRGGGGGGGFRPAPAPSFRPTPNNFRPNYERPANVNRNFERPNEFRPNVNQNVNRGNFANVNRENINRGNINNINRENINNNVNINRNNIGNYRGGYGGYGGYGVNRGWGGYGANYGRYYGYHQGWVNGPWNGGFFPGGGYGYGFGSGYGFGYPGFYGGLGLGLGIGAAAWGLGALSNGWGYSRYANPYYSSMYGAQGPGVVAQSMGGYDYAMPLNLAAAPPADDVIQTAEGSLDQARQAFRAGDYAQALAMTDGALQQTPNDPMLHEFRAVCLFAMGKYDEAAVPFYTVLSAGPGWDWTTMIGLYPDVDTYTQQLRNLEAYCNANPKAAAARFVLAAIYLTQGSTAAAAARLREVVALQPQDKLSAQLLTTLTSTPSGPDPNQPSAVANATAPGAPPSDTPPANPTPALNPAATANANPEPQLPTGPVPANLQGAWTATPAPGVSIALSINPDKTFEWKVAEKGQNRDLKGQATYDPAKNIIALVAPELPPMVATVAMKDGAHFHFKAVGTPNEDPGLDFAK